MKLRAKFKNQNTKQRNLRQIYQDIAKISKLFNFELELAIRLELTVKLQIICLLMENLTPQKIIRQ